MSLAGEFGPSSANKKGSNGVRSGIRNDEEIKD